MTEREYQNAVKNSLECLYDDVAIQWHPFQGEGRSIYAPVVDIAVGPFAIQSRYEVRYTGLLQETQVFIETLIENTITTW